MANQSTTLFRQLLDSPDDPSRWRAFVAHYGPWVKRWVRSRVGRDEVADELTNDLFLKIYLNLGTLRADCGSLRPWISTVIFRQIRSWQRKQRRDRTQSLERAEWAGLQSPDAIRELESYLDKSEYADRYGVALRVLREESRVREDTLAVFFAQVRDGKSARQTAEEFGISVSAAQKYKFRVARAILGLMGLPDDPEHLAVLCGIAQYDASDWGPGAARGPLDRAE
jgi:RNA polymerase sigma factor (sigma-70 family)